MSNYYLIQNGEFAYNKSYSNDYPWGAIKRLDRYPNGTLSTLYICFKANEDICSDFLTHYFETKKWYKGISNISGEGARNHGLLNMSVDDFFNTKHYLPSINEQIKIKEILNFISHRIETQSKIIEDLILFKKGIWNQICLQKSTTWIKTKLSSVLSERKEFALKDDEFIHATLSKDGISAKTDRYNRDFLVTTEEKEYKVTHLNDICYNPANLKFGVICLNKFGDAIFSPIYVTFTISKSYNPSFIELVLTSNSFIQHIRKYEQGTVYERMAVSPEDFLKGEILIPTKNEQEAIAQLFNIMDQKIKKEKDILELYKKQKAYLLKNMFI